MEELIKIDANFLYYFVIFHIIGILIYHFISNNEFGYFSMIVAPVIAAAAVFFSTHYIMYSLGKDFHTFFVYLFSFAVYLTVFFFVLGFDANRHHSNMVSLAFFSLVLGGLFFAACYQFDLLDNINTIESKP